MASASLALVAALAIASPASPYVVKPCQGNTGVRLAAPDVASVWVSHAARPISPLESADVDAAIASFNSNLFGKALKRVLSPKGAHVKITFTSPAEVQTLCEKESAVACAYNWGDCANGIVRPDIFVQDDSGGLLSVLNPYNPGFDPAVATEEDDPTQARVTTVLHELAHALGLQHGGACAAVMNWVSTPVNQALNDEMLVGRNYLPDDIAGLKFLYGSKAQTDLGLTWFFQVPPPSFEVFLPGFGPIKNPVACGGKLCVRWRGVAAGQEPWVEAGTTYKGAPWPTLLLGGSQAPWSGSMKAYLLSVDGKSKIPLHSGKAFTVSGAHFAQPDGSKPPPPQVNWPIPMGVPPGVYSLVYEVVPSGADHWPANNKISTGNIITIF